MKSGLLSNGCKAALLIFTAALCGCVTLEPLEEINIQSLKALPDNKVLLNVGYSQRFVRQIDTHPDRIIVSFRQHKYCKDSGNIVIANPNELPIFIADSEETAQIYPIEEFNGELVPIGQE